MNPREPASVSRQDFYQVQQALHFHIQRGRGHVTTAWLTSQIELPERSVQESMRIIAEVNPRVENVGVDEWTIQV